MPEIITREEALDDMEYICSNYGDNYRLIPLLTQSINAIYDNFEYRFKKEQDAHIDDMTAKCEVINSLHRDMIRFKSKTCETCLETRVCDLYKEGKMFDNNIEMWCDNYQPKVKH